MNVHNGIAFLFQAHTLVKKNYLNNELQTTKWFDEYYISKASLCHKSV